MSMKQTGGNRKTGSSSSGAASASGSVGCAGANAGRHGLTRGRNSAKAHSTPVAFSGVYANMRMVHVLTSVVGAKCELRVKNGTVFEGVFKTYSPECELVLDAAHRNGAELSVSPRREDIVESIIFKASDVVVVHFKDVDLNFAKKVSSEQGSFDRRGQREEDRGAKFENKLTDSPMSVRLNGEHKEKDLEPWDGGDQHGSGSLESLDTDLSNGWDPDDMFKYNEETYGVRSTYDSSLSSYTVPLERDNSEEYLKREARAAQLAEEIEASATYKARVALENDERSEEEKFSAVVRDSHTFNRENKYIPPGQRNREAGLSWGAGRQNSPRLVQCNPGPPTSRASPHDYTTLTTVDQRIVNGGAQHWLSRCPSPSSRPSSRYQSGPNASIPTRPPSRPPSRPSRPPSHPSAHGSPAPLSMLPKHLSLEGPPRMSPKSQRTPRTHRMPSCRGAGPSGVEFLSQGASGEASTTLSRSSPSGGTWSSVVSGGHRPRSPLQNVVGGAPPGSSPSSSPQAGTVPVDSVATPTSATSSILANPAPNMAALPGTEAKEIRHNTPLANKENVKPVESSPSCRPVGKGFPSMPPDHRKQIDNLKKFSVDFRLQSSSNPDPGGETTMTKPPRDSGEKLKESQCDKNMTASAGPKVCSESSGSEDMSAAVGVGSKPGTSPSSSSSTLGMEQKRVPDVTSQGVQTNSPTVLKSDDKEDKKDPVPDSVRKSTLNPNAKEFNPRLFCTPPKPATTPTLTRPQGQPSPSIVMQQPPTVYSQQMCFPHMYPLTPVSPGVQTPAVYHLPVPHMTVSQSKPFRQGKVPSIQQQRPEQHHPTGTSPMMHAATAAGPPVVAQSPVYSTQYFTCNPPQFSSQPLMQQMTHYQSQAQHVFSPVMQGGARMITPSHGQHNLASSSTTQYGEQTHTMYAPIPQQYPHPGATLHPHPSQPPQPSATPTGQAQQSGQHAGSSHAGASPVQHPQHQASLHLASAAPPQQQMYSALTPTPPSMTPGPAPQSPQAVYLHPQQVQHSYNPNHMAHLQQAHMQSGMVPQHHGTPSHPVMLMATQAPTGPQPHLPQSTLNPIPVSSTTHFSYMAHPPVQPHHHQQQL